ncbi:MAG: ankyrin repeat domain-containing protein [Chitinophagaceae bacterium]
MNYNEKIIIDFELHSVEGIQECFANGVDPNGVVKGEPLIDHMVNMYTRSPRFKECIRAFIAAGLQMEDLVLFSVLTDDAVLLQGQLEKDQQAMSKKYTLKCAYTPLYEASLLHICAEYNHVSCAEVLLKHGANINATAGVDEYGFGGQTPLFHTVNQNGNQSADMLHWLLQRKAAVLTTVRGFIWGRSYEWETLMPAVNPVSYAMMGLLPQVHRHEATIAQTVSLLMKHAYGIEYLPGNVPCAYLKH